MFSIFRRIRVSLRLFRIFDGLRPKELVQGLPELAVEIMMGDDYPGGMLVPIDENEIEPTMSDLSKNFVVLRSMLTACPTHVPSSFLIADAWLLAHELLGRKLLKLPGVEHADDVAEHTVRTLALAHGNNVRKLLQKLRLLFRSSEGSRDWKVQELKNMCHRKEFRKPALPDVPDSWSPMLAEAEGKRRAAGDAPREETDAVLLCLQLMFRCVPFGCARRCVYARVYVKLVMLGKLNPKWDSAALQ